MWVLRCWACSQSPITGGYWNNNHVSLSSVREPVHSPGCTWRQILFLLSFLVWTLTILSHRNVIARQSFGVVEIVLLINSLLQGTYVPNGTFGVDLDTRIFQERCPNPLFTGTIHWAICSEVAQFPEHGLGQHIWSQINKRQQDVKISTAPGRAPCDFLPSPTPGKDTPYRTHQYLELQQQTWPGSPTHPVPWVSLWLPVEVAGTIPWHSMLKQTGKQQGLSLTRDLPSSEHPTL